MDESTKITLKITLAFTVPAFVITLALSDIKWAIIVSIIVFIVSGMFAFIGVALSYLILGIGQAAVGMTTDHINYKNKQKKIELKEARAKLEKAFAKKLNTNL